MFAEIIKMMPVPAEPVFFSNGLSLFHFLQEVRSSDLPACILLDINMPIWDGIKTLETLRADTAYHHIPVIIFTTSASPKEKQRCIELGATDFLTKPNNRADYLLLAGEIVKLIK